MQQVARGLYLASAMIWLGNILHIVGVLTHHWQDHKQVDEKFRTHHGLFKMCTAVACYDAEDSRSRRACQAFMIVASITGFLGGVITVAYVLVKMFSFWQPPKFIAYVTTYVCVASFFCSLVGVIIYADVLRYPVLHWGSSFGLVIGGAFLTGVGGALVMVSISNVLTTRLAQVWTPDNN